MPQAWCLRGLLLLLCGLIVAYRLRRKTLFGILVHILFFVTGIVSVGRQLSQAEFDFSRPAAAYRVHIDERPEEKARSILCHVSLQAMYGHDSLVCSCEGKQFLFYFPKDSAAYSLLRGDELLVSARLSPPETNGIPDAFDYARYLRHRGVAGTAYVPEGHWQVVGHNDVLTLRQRALDIREEIVNLYRRLGFQGDELAVLSALMVGYKDELSESIRETYSVTGVSHVLALSGLHIGFLYAVLWFFFSPLRRRYACLVPILSVVTVALLWCFAFLTGLSASVVRATTMFTLISFSSLQRERPLTLNTLSITAFFMLLVHPLWLFDVGFQLSFLAVASIVLIQPWLYGLWQVKSLPLRWVWGLMTVSLAAQLGTAPVVVGCFGRFPVHFLMTNVWVVPLTMLTMYAAVVLLLLTPFPVLQQPVAEVVQSMIRWQNEALRWTERLPYASINGIWLDEWQVAMLLLLLLLVGRVVLLKRLRTVYAPLVVLLLFACYRVMASVSALPDNGIVFYNIRVCTAVHCTMNGASSYLACADSVTGVDYLQRCLQPHWNRLHLDPPQIISGSYLGSDIAMENQVVTYAGRRICLLNDNRWRGKVADVPLTIDYLYISKGFKGRVEELTTLFNIKNVVFDASLSDYYLNKNRHDCIRLGIPYILLKEKGCLKVPITAGF